MATINAGQRQDFYLSATQGLFVSCTGAANIAYADEVLAGPAVVDSSSGEVRVGYFGVPMRVTISVVSGVCSVDTSPSVIQPLTAVQAGDANDSSPLDLKLTVNQLSFAMNSAQIAQAQASNLYTIPEWTPAPAYAPSTAYAGGKAVTNAGRTYLAIVGGTSGSASAPTATTNAPIVDGSVQWLYLGPAPTAIAGAPTLTLEGSTPAPLSRELRTTAQETWYRVRGGNYSFSADGIGWVTGEPKNTSGLCLEFMTDAVDMVVMFRFGTAQYRVAVDDRFVSPDVQIGASTTRLRIQMNGDRRSRKVQIFFNGSNNLYALYVAPADTVWRTSYPNDLNLFVVGDSFIGGSSWHPGTNERSIHHRLAYQLGATQYQADGVGGSGYISSGSETPFGSAARLARISTAADVIVVAGGINDPVSGLQAAVVAYLQAVRARCPNAFIFVCGSWAGNTGPSADILNKEGQISAAVASITDPKIAFAPVSTANNAVTFGTGNVSSLANNGNSDFYTSPDGIHPIVQACQYLANRVAIGLMSSH